MEDKQKVYIKGDSKRGDEVIKFLEDLGGYNCCSLDGHNSNNYYYIAPDGSINNITYPANLIFSFVKEFYKEVELPRWKPEHTGRYYYITTKGEIMEEVWYNIDSDNSRYEFGNCFKTFEEAEAARDKIKDLLKHT